MPQKPPSHMRKQLWMLKRTATMPRRIATGRLSLRGGFRAGAKSNTVIDYVLQSNLWRLEEEDTERNLTHDKLSLVSKLEASGRCGPGRPRAMQTIADLTLRMAIENSPRG